MSREVKNNDKNGGGKKRDRTVLRFPYDSTNCIRFKGYALSSDLKTEHPHSELSKARNSLTQK